MSHQAIVDDIFEELARGSSNPSQEKRRHARQALRVSSEVMVNLYGERNWIPITLRDISPAGCGLVSPRLFYVGKFLVVHLEIKSPGQAPKHVLSQVRGSRCCGRRLYQIGVEFKNAITAGKKRDYFPETWFQLLQAAQSNETRT